jgi:putative spermidine/putrescine transport system substrate-binding protein
MSKVRRRSGISESVLALAAMTLLSASPAFAQAVDQPPARTELPPFGDAEPPPPFGNGEPQNGSDRLPEAESPASPLQSDSAPSAPERDEQAPAAAEAPPSEPPAPSGQPPAAPAENAGQDANPPAPAQPSVTVARPRPDPKGVTLKIATWSGAYGQSQERAFFKPFTTREGYRIESVKYDGSYDDLKDQARSPDWSLVDIDGETASRACGEQLLEPLDPAVLQSSPDGASAQEDFLPGAIQPCAIASVAWSALIVSDQGLKRKPAALEDFFDTRKIPGKRLLPKQPRYTLELALMATGVEPRDVYTVLATPEGQDRAFAKLSAIKGDILWWDKPSDVFARIAQKEAVMGLAFNGRAFMAIVGARQPLDMLWDHQIYAFDYWAIPRGAPHVEAAKEFIRFATAPGQLADQTRWMPYGPARRSAVQIVGKHAEIDLNMKPFLPTHEPNLKTALGFDGQWWAVNEPAIKARFADWLEGRQRVAPINGVTSQ